MLYCIHSNHVRNQEFYEDYLFMSLYTKKGIVIFLPLCCLYPGSNEYLLLQAHEDLVEDVAWHLKDEHIFGSVGDDCKLMMWDLRTNKPEQSILAHRKEVSML
jgi:histone-binding protein RBBP4